MDRSHELSSCIVHNGTVSYPRDMVRALETIEVLTYRQLVDGEVMADGRATLVKIMAEPESSTILVNGCLFINVLSFRYLNFATDEEGACVFELVSEGMTLEMTPVDDPENAEGRRMPTRLLEVEAYEPAPFLLLDDDDEDER